MNTINIPSLYEALNLIMKYYPDNFTDESKVEIEILFDYCLDNLSNNSEKFLTTLFIKSLKKHIGPTSFNENLYLKKYEIPQIELFDILIKDFPFVKIGHDIVNNLITNEIKNKNNVAILDIGIGMGTQMMNLLNNYKQFENIKNLTLIGIEPFENALNSTQNHFKNNYHFPFKFNFIPINDFIENINFKELSKLIKTLNANLIVNNSLSLHHIQSSDKKNVIIKNIRDLNPDAFFLIEPNVNHDEEDFYKRFQNCFNHFYNVFLVIDNLNIENNEKNALKLFFGREIEDIIGNPNDERFERHELAKTWIKRLNNNNFGIKPIENIEIDKKYGISSNFYEDGFLGLSFGSEIILAIINASSK